MGLIADTNKNGTYAFALAAGSAKPWWFRAGMQIGEILPTDTVADICRKAAIDFGVSLVPLFTRNADGTYSEVSDFCANQRDNGDVLGIVSPDFKNVSAGQLLAGWDSALKNNGLSFETALAYKGGRIICATARLGDDYRSVIGADQIDTVLNFSTGFDGTRATMVSVGNVVVVCQNTDNAATYAADKAGKLIRVSHRQNFNGADIRAMLESAKGSIVERVRIGNALLDKRISDDDAQAYFADLLGFDIADVTKADADGKPLVATRTRNVLTSLLDAYAKGPGAAARAGTAWGAYNAVTYWADHEASTRDTNGDGTGLARAYSAQFAKGATVKAKALESICERSGVALAA